MSGIGINSMEEFQISRDYWLDKLSGDIGENGLIPDYITDKADRFAMCEIDFSDSYDKKLLNISNGQDLKLYTVLLAVLKVLLFKYSQNSDITVLSPLYEEFRSEHVGACEEQRFIALRDFIDASSSFRELLNSIKQTLSDAYKNQHYPLEEILDLLGTGEKGSLFKITARLKNIHGESPEEFSHFRDYNQFVFDFARNDGSAPERQITGKLFYNPGLFRPETAKGLSKKYTYILSQALENIDIKIADIRILNVEEEDVLLHQYNNTGAVYPENCTIQELFEQQAARTPNNIAVEYEQEQLTYKDLNEKANALARHLREKGIKKDCIIAILADRSLEMIIGMLGVLKAGGAYLPIDPGYPEERIKYMLDDSNACILLDKSLTAQERQIRTINLDDEEIYVRDSSNLDNINAPGDLAYVIYTSGTTGKPKGAMIEHRNVVRLMVNDRMSFDFNSRDVWTMFHSYCFDFSVWEMYGALLYGGRLVVVPKGTAQNPLEFLKLLKSKKVTVLNQVPTPFYNLAREELEENDKKLKLRYVIFGGEALKPAMLKAWRKKYPETALVNMYGITETTVHVTFKEITDDEIAQGVSNIGRPIPTLTVFVMDQQLKLMPPGVPGELCVGGAGVGRGYLNRPELTAERFIPNPFYSMQNAQCKMHNGQYTIGENPEPEQFQTSNFKLHTSKLYRSGDLVRLLPDGDMEYLGRIDQQVKIRGHRIELGEVESRLLQHEAVREAVVAVRQDINEELSLFAYVVFHRETTIAELREHLMQALPEYMIPSCFIKLERLPLTANGKVDKKSLASIDLSRYVTESGDETGYAGPRDRVEQKLTEIWSEVLDRAQISIYDNFFELGGHSIKAAYMLSRIQKEFSVELSLREVFEAQTVIRLAESIKKTGKSFYASIKPAQSTDCIRENCYPASSAQKRLYILDQFEEIRLSYNIPIVVLMEREIDRARLEGIFRKLVERHEAFRTSFEFVEGEPVQRIHHAVEFEMEYAEIVDLSGNEAVIESEAKSLVRKFFRPFDLSKAPLFRAGLIKLGENRYVMMCDMHHIIADGTSRGILTREFAFGYAGEELPDLHIQYKDFSVWQNNLFRTDKIKSQEEYWLNRFSGEVPVLKFPTDHPRPPIKSFEGDFFTFSTGAGLAAELYTLAGGTGTTLFMVLLAAFNVLLFKYSGQEDLVVGSPIAGRQDTELENIIGMFVNTLALRNHIVPDKSFLEFLESVRETALDAYENQDYQFEELVEKLDLKRDMGRNPLFDVSFAMQNMDLGEREVAHFNFKPFSYENRTSKFDMTFEVIESGGNINFNLEYCTALFSRDSMERIGAHFINILRSIARKPATTVALLDILDEVEKSHILYDFNNTGSVYPDNRCIHELFEKQAEKTPDHVAVICGTETLTYGRLNENAGKLAKYICHQQKNSSDIFVGLLMDRSTDLVAAILGVLKSGGAYVPIDPEMPEERIRTIIDDANISLVLSQKKYIRMLNRLQWDCRSFNTYLCIDSKGVFSEDESVKNELMDQKLWEYVAENATDDISGGGWSNSYTGGDFSRDEMNEYAENTFRKLQPYLHKKARVLEIGCASGISMYRISPYVGMYYGTDLSETIIAKNKRKVAEEGIENIRLACLPAHEIDKIDEKGYDIIILNSVIQSFHGHNYLRKVILKLMDLANDQGILFIGDIMDQDLKPCLIDSLVKYKEEHKDPGVRTKTDFSNELFISRNFLEDLAGDIKDIKKVDFSGKYFTLKNELSLYRYDAIFEIDKKQPAKAVSAKNKRQHDINMVDSYSPDFVSPKSNPLNLAYVIFTSGSTGKPKGVMINHRSLTNYIYWAAKVYVDNERLDFPLYSSISFDLTVTSVFTPLITGNRIIVYEGEDKALLIRKIVQEDKAGIIKLTPTHLKLIEDMDIKNVNLRKFIVGGEEFKTDTARKIYTKFNGKVELYNEYGPTEATVGCMIHRYSPRTDDRSSVPIGVPADNVRIYILDKYLKPVPQGVVGELFISGDGLAVGYLNKPELTADKFVENPFVGSPVETLYTTSLQARMYKTGDLARWLPDGKIECLGRVDHQIKIRGYRVELDEIEVELLKHENVKEAVVTAGEEKDGSRFICAYLTADIKLTVAALRSHLSRTLPDYMIPSYFVQLEKMPLNNNGKLDRKALPDPVGGMDTGTGYVAPRNVTEEKLVEIWREILGVERIGIDDDFFDLGGHSLKASSMVFKIYREFGTEMPLKEVFRTPTVRELSQYILGAGANGYPPIHPVALREYYPLSGAQRRIFAMYQLEGGQVGYNMPWAGILTGKLDRDWLEEVFGMLVKRHEALRTSFEFRDGEPVQYIHKTVDFKIEEINLPRDPKDPKDTRDPRKIAGDFIRPFDLAKAPLIRVGLVKLEENSYLLMYDMHHIISDGVSINMLVNEFAKLYSGQDLPPLKLQYKDFAVWQNGILQSDTVAKQEEFWMSRLSGTIPVLDMPLDYPRPSIQSFEGNRLGFELGKELSGGLNTLASETGATLYMLILAACHVLLFKYTGQEDIIIGSPVSGRCHADLENVIGMFSNNLLMRNYPKGGMTFRDFLKNVGENAMAAYENQDYQFDELVKKLKPVRDLSRNPMFDVALSMQNLKDAEVELGDLKVEALEFEHGVARTDLIFIVFETSQGLFVVIEYCSRLFKKASIVKMKERFTGILAQVTQNPDIVLDDIRVSKSMLAASVDMLKENEGFDFELDAVKEGLE